MNVLLVDDHALFREGMKFLLRNLDEDLGLDEASDLEAAIVLAKENPYDLVLLDLKMPGVGGLDALAAVREASPASPIVVLSGEDTPRIVRSAIEVGAMGFIPKSATHEILIQALKLVLAGGVYLPPRVLAGDDAGAPIGTESSPGRVSIQGLSERQLQVLRCVIQGKPNKVIARELDVSEHTVKSHLSAVLRALGARNRTEAVYEAAKLGLHWSEISAP